MNERCPGTGTQYLPIYDHLRNGQTIKALKSCPGCGRLMLVDARRPWLSFHKRAVGQTYKTYWAPEHVEAEAT